MKSSLHDLAIAVGFEVVNVDEGFTNYEFIQNISGIENVSYLIKVVDKPSMENFELTFHAIINVLPRKLKKRIYKLIKHSKLGEDDKALELVLFAVEEFKTKSDYYKLKEYGKLVKVDIEKLGYEFAYNLTKKDIKAIVAKIEQAIPMEYAPALGKIKRIEYKIGFVKNNVKL